MQSAILMAAFTKPHFNFFATTMQTLYFHIPVGGHSSYGHLFHIPRVTDCPLARASTVLAVYQRKPVFLVCAACYHKGAL